MSHLPTTPRSSLKAGTLYGQFQMQYSQPMHASASCRTMPVRVSFVYARVGQPVMQEGSRQWLHPMDKCRRCVCGYTPPSTSPTRRQET